jgi:hypothetical protein
MKQPIFLMIGVPGSGKSWVAERVGHKFDYVHHDGFRGHINQPEAYVETILSTWKDAKKPVLAEAPFSVSHIKDPLEKAGAHVKSVIIVEDKHVLSERYKNDPKRDGKDIPKGHLTRMGTYLSRAREYNAFVGNSTEVLKYLKHQVADLAGQATSSISRRADEIEKESKHG